MPVQQWRMGCKNRLHFTLQYYSTENVLINGRETIAPIHISLINSTHFIYSDVKNNDDQRLVVEIDQN